MGLIAAGVTAAMDRKAATVAWGREKRAATTAYERSQESVLQAQDYSTTMSNTAYQRSMADLEKAGLNPILVGKLGGASSPMGQMASAPKANPPKNEGWGSRAVAAFHAGKSVKAQIEQLSALTNKTNEEAQLTTAKRIGQLADNEMKQLRGDIVHTAREYWRAGRRKVEDFKNFDYRRRDDKLKPIIRQYPKSGSSMQRSK